MEVPSLTKAANYDFNDSGRSSPIATSSMKESLHVTQSPLDVAVITCDENDENDVIDRVTSAMMVLQQSFEERHLLQALSILKTALHGTNRKLYVISFYEDYLV